MKIVLQKFLASAGVASRRQAEELIRAGKVTVNGQRAELGQRVSEEDDVRLRGQKLFFTTTLVYIKLNKPSGYVCTSRSFPGEKNIFELVKINKPLTIVGRLDKDSEGLVILTNDGDLAYQATHPKFGLEKVYLVTLRSGLGNTKKEEKEHIGEIRTKFRQGIDIGLGDGVVKAERVKHLRGRTFEVVLRQGKKRQIRRMFRKLNHSVGRLVRVRIGNITVGKLKSGEWEYIPKGEVAERLKALLSKSSKD